MDSGDIEASNATSNQTKTDNMKTTGINHIEAAINYVRACQPVSANGIAHEILTQVVEATKDNCKNLAAAAINHGLKTGWLEKYDDQSFCIA